MNKDPLQHVFRVDKFLVPAAAREVFLDKVQGTHQVLRSQPGFVRDVVLEQTSGPGRFNLVTIVEWESESVIEAARAAVQASHAQSGFSAQELMTRLGIEADLAMYRPLVA